MCGILELDLWAELGALVDMVPGFSLAFNGMKGSRAARGERGAWGLKFNQQPGTHLATVLFVTTPKRQDKDEFHSPLSLLTKTLSTGHPSGGWREREDKKPQ